MMATFSTSSSGWLSLSLQEKNSYENHWTAEASDLFSMQRKPDPILEVPRIQNKLTSNGPGSTGKKKKKGDLGALKYEYDCKDNSKLILSDSAYRCMQLAWVFFSQSWNKEREWCSRFLK